MFLISVSDTGSDCKHRSTFQLLFLSISIWSPSSLYFLPHLLSVLVLFLSSHLITILITVKSHWSSSSLPLSYRSESPSFSPTLALILSPPPKAYFSISSSLFLLLYLHFSPFWKSNIFGSELSVEPLSARVCVCVSVWSVHEQVSSLKLTSKRPSTYRYRCHTYCSFCLFYTLLHTQTLMQTETQEAVSLWLGHHWQWFWKGEIDVTDWQQPAGTEDKAIWMHDGTVECVCLKDEGEGVMGLGDV